MRPSRMLQVVNRCSFGAVVEEGHFVLSMGAEVAQVEIEHDACPSMIFLCARAQPLDTQARASVLTAAVTQHSGSASAT
jgi:hypothetical protein